MPKFKHVKRLQSVQDDRDEYDRNIRMEAHGPLLARL